MTDVLEIGGETACAADGDLCVIAVTARVCIEPQHEWLQFWWLQLTSPVEWTWSISD